MKYALVTGSTRGIGKAVSDQLTENGYTVFRNGRTADEKYKYYIRADLSSLEGVTILADSLLQQTKQIDTIILNVGATCKKPMNEITPEDWLSVMNTNVTMPFFLIQRLAEHITEKGCILFISSAMSLWPHATSIPYGVSKAAVNMLAQALVKEFSAKQIRVNAICPGFIDTYWQKEKPVWLKEKIERKTALKRFGTPEEIADMCMSILKNSYINGTIVRVDGGYGMMQ